MSKSFSPEMETIGHVAILETLIRHYRRKHLHEPFNGPAICSSQDKDTRCI